MKKTAYISPVMQIMQVCTATLIAQSLRNGGNASENLDQGDEGDVKRGGGVSYNVWNDDWSR